MVAYPIANDIQKFAPHGELTATPISLARGIRQFGRSDTYVAFLRLGSSSLIIPEIVCESIRRRLLRRIKAVNNTAAHQKDLSHAVRDRSGYRQSNPYQAIFDTD